MTVSKQKEIKKAVLTAFPHTIPVLTGYLILGMAYGILMQTKGYGAFWSVLMSLVAYGGSMQFAAIALLTSIFNPLQAFLLSIMVNARHLFYGISMLDKYKGLGKARAILIFMLSDETFSISSSVTPPQGVNRKFFFLTISVLDYLYWAIGTFLGSVIGGFITFNTAGLDFVLTALFVVLFLEQTKQKENQTAGLIGLLAAIAGRLIFGAENMVIPSMVIILLILLLGRKKI